MRSSRERFARANSENTVFRLSKHALASRSSLDERLQLAGENGKQNITSEEEGRQLTEKRGETWRTEEDTGDEERGLCTLVRDQPRRPEVHNLPIGTLHYSCLQLQAANQPGPPCYLPRLNSVPAPRWFELTINFKRVRRPLPLDAVLVQGVAPRSFQGCRADLAPRELVYCRGDLEGTLSRRMN